MSWASVLLTPALERIDTRLPPRVTHFFEVAIGHLHCDARKRPNIQQASRRDSGVLVFLLVLIWSLGMKSVALIAVSHRRDLHCIGGAILVGLYALFAVVIVLWKRHALRSGHSQRRSGGRVPVEHRCQHQGRGRKPR
jgi:hypothetical protein